MWPLFMLTCITLIAIITLPGYALAKVMKLNQLQAIGFTPPASIAIYTIFGIVFDKLGIKGPAPLLISSFVLTAFFFMFIALRSRRQKKCECKLRRPGRVTIEITCSIVVCSGLMTVLFLANLDTANSFLEFADNVSHLNTIASMINGGSFSTLNASEYSANGQQAAPYSTPGSFYPAGWHIVIALACSITNALAPLGENAGAYVFASVVFASGMAALLLQSFPEKKGIAAIGSVTFCACAAFPIAPLDVHQIYPNFAGWCCLPGAVAFVASIIEEHPRRFRASVVTCTIAIIGLGVLHPNCVISLFIYATTYLIMTFWSERTSKQTSVIIPLTKSVVVFGIMVAVWLLLLDSSVFASVTSFLWEWTTPAIYALKFTLLFGYTYGEPQWLFALVVYIGFFCCLRNKQTWWISLTFIIFSIIFFFNASGDPLLKKIFAGYWYTDPERTAACAAIAAIPCAAIGLYQIILLMQRAFEHVTDRVPRISKPISVCAIALAILLAFLQVCYSPMQLFSSNASSMGFRTYDLNIKSILQNRTYYTNQEKNFVDEVKSTVPENSTILNLPYDGSVLAFSVNDMQNLYYKTLSGANESTESKLIRSDLRNIASNNDVKLAVKSINAQYVMLLDRGDESQFNSIAWGTPGDPDWQGFCIDEKTEGFELVLAQDNLRLFKICY